MQHRRRFIMVVAFIAGLGGVLFGYDTGVISGALLFIKPQFNLDNVAAGFVTGAVLIGAMIGALGAGSYADKFGRRNANVVSGVIFAVAAIGTALVPAGSTWLLIIGRILVGVGIGGNSVAATMYIAEVAPKKARGALVSLYQLAITVGIFLSYLIDAGLADTGDSAWRWMFGLAFIPAVGLAVGMLFMPRSPRWLIKMDLCDECRQVLEKVGVDTTVEEEIATIQKDLAESQPGKWSELMASPIRKAAILAVLVMFIQQLTGINTIIYYAPFIFKEAGFESNVVSLLATAGVGAVNVLATLIAISLIDKLGRRKLLLIGVTGMALSLIVLGVAFLDMGHPRDAAATPPPPSSASAAVGTVKHALNIQAAAATQPNPDPAKSPGIPNPMLGIVTIACLMSYITCFAFSLGPIAWVIITEFFPNNMRSRGVALGSAANWSANFVVTQTFLIMLAVLGATLTFWSYAAVGLVSVVLIWKLVPETKGYTLEEIEARWLRGGEMLK